MPSEVALLIYVIIGGFVALLLFGCRDMILDGLMALNSNTRGWLSRRTLNPAKMLENTYSDLQRALIESRAAAAESKKKERQLRDELDTVKAKADRAKRKDGDAANQEDTVVSIEFKVKIRQAEEALAKQEKVTKACCQRIDDLEGEVQKAYTQKQILIARDKAARASLDAHAALYQVDSNSSESLLERIEKAIAEKEASVAARLSKLQKNLSPEKLQQLGKTELEQAKSAFAQGAEALDATIQMSAESEAAMEHQIRRAAKQAQVWEERSQMAEKQNNEGLAYQARQRMVPYEESVIQLTTNLAHLAACTASIRLSQRQLSEAIERIDARLAELQNDTNGDGSEETRKIGA